MFGNHSSSHQLTKPAPRLALRVKAADRPVSPSPVHRCNKNFVRYFTNFRTTDILYKEKSHGGRIVTIDAQVAFQSTVLSVWKSWANSHIVPQRRRVITTDWPPQLRAT
jgi:hypothetical protein